MQKPILNYLPAFERYFDWLMLGLLIFIPLYFKFPLAGVQGTFVSIRFEDVLIALSTIIFVVFLYLKGKIKVLFQDLLFQSLVVFLFVGVVSTFSAVFLTHTVSWHIAVLHLLRRVELLSLLLIASSLVIPKSGIYKYLTGLTLVSVLVIVYGLGQKWLKFPAISTTNSELSKGLIYFVGPGDRVSSTFAGHYDFAVFLLMVLSLLFPFAFYLWNRRKITHHFPLKAGLFVVLMLAIFISLITTAARLSFLASILSVLLSLILLNKRKYILVAIVFLGVFLIYPSNLQKRLIATFTVNIQKTWNAFGGATNEQLSRSRLNIPTLPSSKYELIKGESEAADIVPGEPTNTTDLGVFRSFDIRVKVEWPRALRSLAKNPFLGTGYSSLGLATDNDFLRLLGEVGLLGTWAFLLFLWVVIKRVRGLYRNSRGFMHYFAVGMVAMVFAFVVNGLFIDVFEASKVASVFWIIVGLALNMEKLERGHAQ